MNKKLIVAALAVSFLASACCWKNNDAMFANGDMKVLVADADMKTSILIL